MYLGLRTLSEIEDILKKPFGKFSPVETIELPLSRQQQADNCDRLANIMERLTNNQHNQFEWANPEKTICKTSGCAMGWAAMSGEIPGLQWGYELHLSNQRLAEAGHPVEATAVVRPFVNGVASNWTGAAGEFFGNATFTGASFTREMLIEGLKRQAKILRNPEFNYWELQRRIESAWVSVGLIAERWFYPHDDV